MNAIGSIIATQLWKLIQPWLEAQWKQHGPELVNKIKAFITDQFKEWMPQIIEATIVAVAQSAGQLTVDTVDKVTSVIPGDLDDQIVDHIKNAVLGKLEWFKL